MRKDSIGLFWQDLPPEKKQAAEKVKKTPPEAIWLRDDYLPGLEEARAFPVQVMSDADLLAAKANNESLIFDIESYWNYWCIAFMSYETGKVIVEEMFDDIPGQINTAKLQWIVDNFALISFNGINYDIPILSLALNGHTCKDLKQATNEIIQLRFRPYQVLRKYKTKSITPKQHVDLIEVAPLRASLKVYGGRLHAPKMQDLPFHHDSQLSRDKCQIVKWYCVNDLTNTAYLYSCLHEEIQLRDAMSVEYGTDLLSKSDAQIAEAVIVKEVSKLNGGRIRAPEIAEGKIYKYIEPSYIKFETPLMKAALEIIRNADYVVGMDGRIKLPPEVKALKLRIGESVHRMGIGGLHSSEKKVHYKSNDKYILLDHDVTSFYPKVILNLRIFPQHLGPIFLNVYGSIVARRVIAKKAKQKVKADSLKIVVNGGFGKFASPFSDIYSPFSLIQTTIGGQLSLLMLIERLELRWFRVVNSNTDGIVIYCSTERINELDEIIAQWEKDTNLEMERTPYAAMYSRDVNNYIAIKMDGTVKYKGAYANPWKSGKLNNAMLHKNPTGTVCIDAVEEYLINGTAIEQTVQTCQDIRKFVNIRKVEGGAVKLNTDCDNEYLGESIRWYYVTGDTNEIVYAKSGNKVPNSEGAKPLMQLPNCLPNDIDYDWYINKAKSFLTDFGID